MWGLGFRMYGLGFRMSGLGNHRSSYLFMSKTPLRDSFVSARTYCMGSK